jgi:hypothetical protein
MKTKLKEPIQDSKDMQDVLHLLVSEEWRIYVNFLKNRVQDFQQKVNDAVEKGDILEAKVQLALLKDNTKLRDSFQMQVKQSKNKEKES